MTGSPFNCASANDVGCCPERSMNKFEKSAWPNARPIGGAEGGADDDGDREVDNVSAGDELLEFS